MGHLLLLGLPPAIMLHWLLWDLNRATLSTSMHCLLVPPPSLLGCAQLSTAELERGLPMEIFAYLGKHLLV